jgi:hydroxypyruvate reductase/glycerate 2-kinase
MTEQRRVVLDAIEAGLDAIDPLRALEEHAQVEQGCLVVDGRQYRLDAYDRVVVFGAGKASLRVAEGLVVLLGDKISDGLVVVPNESSVSLARVDIMVADHPLPSQRSVMAAEAALRLASGLGPKDLMIACITGGSSSLLCAPPHGVSLEDKRALHQRLLSNGATIREINTVRKQVSRVKGGRLAAASSAGSILNLTVSDVAGDQLDLITDPTVANTTTARDAVEILHNLGLWENVAPSIRTHLLRNMDSESPSLDHLDVHTVTIATGNSARASMEAAVARHGVQPVWLGSSIEGAGHELGLFFGELAATSAREGTPFSRRSALLACGGEATANVDEYAQSFGMGGPCQELIIGAAERLRPEDRVALIAIDTDGADGSSQHAGAVVDGLTAERARGAGLSLARHLHEHRSSAFARELGDAVVTGPTGTNVNDMLAIVIM